MGEFTLNKDYEIIHQQVNRKDEHMEYAVDQYRVEPNIDFEQTRFIHHSFSQMGIHDVDLSTKVGDLSFEHPFFINAMTGGSEHAKSINQRLAILARETGLAIASGSMSIALNDPSTIDSFKIIRKESPNGLVFANLGAHHSVENAQKVIDWLEADALQLHINIPQEIIMPEGDRDFRNWLQNIEQIVKHVSVPVWVKEVGFGMSRNTIRQLSDIGVKYVDVAGSGGTNFAKIENARRTHPIYEDIENWGQSTMISLVEAMSIPCSQRPQIIATGGVRSPLDIIKCLAMGAQLVGISGHFLQLAQHEDSEGQAIASVHQWQEQLRNLMTLLGCRTIRDLQRTDLILAPGVQQWCQARHIDWTLYANRHA